MPAFPDIRAEYGMAGNSSQVGWIVTAFFLGLASGPWFYGPMSDRYGRRPLLFAGLVLYVVAAGAALNLVLPWRVVFVLPACVAVGLMVWIRRLPETLPPERRRPFTWASVSDAARQVVTHRQIVCFTLAVMFLFGVITAYLLGSLASGAFDGTVRPFSASILVFVGAAAALILFGATSRCANAVEGTATES